MAIALPTQLRLQPTKGTHPLWDDSSGMAEATAIDPASPGLSQGLVVRLRQWDEVFQRAAPDPTEKNLPQGKLAPFVWHFADMKNERAWYEQGVSIAADLNQEMQRLWATQSTLGKLVVRLSNLETLIKRAMGTQSPWEWKPEDHVARIGQQCGVPEIGRVIERLNELSIARAETPDWDGDTNDDIAKAQLMFGQILGAVPSHYLDDIAKGFSSDQSDTRFYVGYGMAKHGKAALPWLTRAIQNESDLVTRTTLDMLISAIE